MDLASAPTAGAPVATRRHSRMQSYWDAHSRRYEHYSPTDVSCVLSSVGYRPPMENHPDINDGPRRNLDVLRVSFSFVVCLVGCKMTWEDSETPPVPVGIFRSVSLDVGVGTAACTWVSQSGVRGTVGVCRLGVVCVCAFSELC